MPGPQLYRASVRPLLFRMDAERAHLATLRIAGAVGRSAAGRALVRALYGFEDPRLRIAVGIDNAAPAPR